MSYTNIINAGTNILINELTDHQPAANPLFTQAQNEDAKQWQALIIKYRQENQQLLTESFAMLFGGKQAPYQINKDRYMNKPFVQKLFSLRDNGTNGQA